MENQPEIKEINSDELNSSKHVPTNVEKTKRTPRFRRIDSTYAEILQSFTSILGIKGRPFGQLNKPEFGMSDGNEGVQWNILVIPDRHEVQVGINLEGKEYSGWPITTFILSELEKPSIKELKTNLEHPELFFVRFRRDAWQVTSRPIIVEQLLSGWEIPMSEMDSQLWASILTEALSCLSEEKHYRGRNKQEVTLASQPERRRAMKVSPHLTIWTPVTLSGDISSNLESAIKQLKPVHEWVSNVSR